MNIIRYFERIYCRKEVSLLLVQLVPKKNNMCLASQKNVNEP